jgi:hypothetical protein
MSALTILAIGCFSVGASAGFVGTLLSFMMTGEVNRKRDDRNQIPYFNWPPGKRSGILAEYRRLYPEGRLHIWLFAAFAVTAIGVFAALLCIYLMGPIPSTPAGR